MKQLLVILAVLAVAILGGRWAWQRFGGAVTEESVEQRVTTVLENMEAGGDEQTATCTWATGKATISDITAMGAAVDGFARWRRAKGLTRAISSFSVDEVDVSGDVPWVSVTIDGQEHALEAPKGEPIAWAD